MFGPQVANETLVGGTASGDLSVNVFGEQHRCLPTGGRRQVWIEPADGSSVDGYMKRP